MTPENDKTLRGIFRKTKIGIDEWNDRRDYRKKYESEFKIKGNISEPFGIPFLPLKYERNKNILNNIDHENEEEKYFEKLYTLIPESKIVKKHIYINSFGFGPNENGEYTCDCCGIVIHPLNSIDKKFLCDKCSSENVENFTL